MPIICGLCNQDIPSGGHLSWDVCRSCAGFYHYECIEKYEFEHHLKFEIDADDGTDDIETCPKCHNQTSDETSSLKIPSGSLNLVMAIEQLTEFYSREQITKMVLGIIDIHYKYKDKVSIE